MLPGMMPTVAGSGEQLSIAYKGHGFVYLEDDAGPTTLNYGTVSNGSAPAAGDFVVWQWLIGFENYNSSGPVDQRRQDLTGSGWVQDNEPAIIPASTGSAALVSTILAKILEAGDLSSPPTIHPDASGLSANYGKWTAYTLTGTPSSITIPVHTRNVGGSSAPSNVAVDSTSLNPPEAAITCTLATGTDGAISLSGITLDHELTQANIGGSLNTNTDLRIGEKLDVGGASYTLSKGDDGADNMLVGAVVAVA